MTDEQTHKISRLINHLLTDLEPMYAERCIGRPFPWDQAVQLVSDTIEDSLGILAPPTVRCPYCSEQHEVKNLVGQPFVVCPDCPPDELVLYVGTDRAIR